MRKGGCKIAVTNSQEFPRGALLQMKRSMRSSRAKRLVSCCVEMLGKVGVTAGVVLVVVELREIN